MARFKITWESGAETEYEQSDCHTVEQFINCRFGAGAEVTAKVEIIGEKVEVAPPPPPVAPAPATKPPAKQNKPAAPTAAK